MFEIRYVDCWDLGVPSYYLIYKDGKLWYPISCRNEWEAIEEIRAVNPEAARNLEELYSSVA